MTANIDVELAPARMPDQATLAALGAFWVRFAGLERAVDISIGILLRVGYMRMQSVTSNLNMRSKLDMVESLVALEQITGNNGGKERILYLVKQIRRLNDARAKLAHGTFAFDTHGDGWHIVKRTANKKHIVHSVVKLDTGTLNTMSEEVKDLSFEYFWAVRKFMANQLDWEEFFLGEYTRMVDELCSAAERSQRETE